MRLARPKSIAEMVRQTENFVTEESYRRGLAFVPEPSDVVVTPYAKCGTTWMQQIVPGLRTGGSMAFEEITEVVPWLELAHNMGWDLNAPQVARPRAFKSHLRWDEIPKGARYIVVMRDPCDAMLSLYRFLEGWHFEAGAITISEFADYYLNRADSHNYWSHAASWWRQRARPEVLLLSFEAMKRDLPGAVDRVADFIGVPADPAVRAIATQQAGFAFMKQNGHKFDDHVLRVARDAACGLPQGGVATKVASGKVGGGRPEINAPIRAKLDARWQDTIAAEFGLPTYAGMARLIDEA